ncbi:MAG: hypothetical protein KA163_14450 [Bacteroidia bacterium]|nr:hypothetical protein [Bacteroidia bacterium]
MKKILFIAFSILFLNSCIKKKAIKAEPDLVGTWVSKEGGYYSWLIISSDGNGKYRTYDYVDNKDFEFSGITKYSLFESKLYVGDTKFKVISPISGNTGGVHSIDARDYNTLNIVNYPVKMKIVLKTSILHGSRVIHFYKI